VKKVATIPREVVAKATTDYVSLIRENGLGFRTAAAWAAWIAVKDGRIPSSAIDKLAGEVYCL